MQGVDVQRKQDAQHTPSTERSPAQPGLEDPLGDPLTVQMDGEDDGVKERTGKGTDSGAMSWSSAMGEFIGGGLYKLVAGEVSEAKLAGHATGAVNSAVGEFEKWLKTQTSTPDEAAATKQLAGEIKKHLGAKAKALMDEDGGDWANKIGEFTDKNPWIIASAAMAAAATYVLTNQKIPAMKVPISLGDAGKLAVGATLDGGMMDLFKGDVFLSEMTASYASKDGALKVSAKHKSTEDDSGGTLTEQEMALKLVEDDTYAELYGSRKLDDGDMTSGKLGMKVGQDTDKLDLYGQMEHLFDDDGYEASTLGGGFSLDDKGAGLGMSGSAMGGTDGRYALDLKLKKMLTPELALSASGHKSMLPGVSGMEDKYGMRGGLDYKKGDFSAGGFVGHESLNGVGNTTAGFSLKMDF